MPDPQLRVFWICGSAGAGKSVAAWALFEELSHAGHGVAFLDIDQLGMLYPEDDDDPERHSLKAAALGALAPGYTAANAQLLVVSGVIDPDAGPRPALGPGVELTLCLLAPDPSALRGRILARGWDDTDAEEAVTESAMLRKADFVDVTIDTHDLSVAETVARLRKHVEHGEAPTPMQTSPVESSSATDVLMVTGPRAAGSSTIGFALAMRRWRAARRTAFVDLQQLGFLSGHDGRPGSDTSLAIAQLAVTHELMSARGAELLVVSGHLGVSDRQTLRQALPAARVTLVRLRADSRAIQEHIRSRLGGSDARLAGDDLLNADQPQQDLVVATALAEQAVLEAAALDDLVVDVSGRTPAAVVAELEALDLLRPKA